MDKVEPLLEELKKEIGASNFNIWFNTTDIYLNNNTLIFSVPNKFFKDIINESYKETILNIWKNLDNQEELNFIYNINESPETVNAEENNINIPEIKNNNLDNYILNKSADTEKNSENKKNLKKTYLNVNPKYTFENFVIGMLKLNRVANNC